MKRNNKSVKSNNKRISNKKNNANKKKPLVSKKKMSGGATIHINDNFIYLFLVIIAIYIMYYFYNNYTEEKNQIQKLETKIEDVNKQLTELNKVTTSSSIQSIFTGNDLNNPAINTNRIPINIRTRGEPEPYSQIGYLFIDNATTTTQPANTEPQTEITTETNTINLTTNVNVNTSNNNNVLPLYGRRVYIGGDKWNYYILNDNYNQIRMPLMIDGKDSMDEYGVRELYDNDTVFVSSYGKTFKVKIYEKEGPRYIPF